MLEDGPLLAPSCYRLPPNLDPVKVYHWFFLLEVHLISEIFTLSSKSVLYEMAAHCMQRPRARKVAVVESSGLAAVSRASAEALRRFEHYALLQECRMLFLNHFQAGLRTIRFQPALERLLPLDPAAQPPIPDPEPLSKAASRTDSIPSSEGPAGECVVEEVDRERWVFRDVEDDRPQRISHQGSHTSTAGSSAGAASRVRLGSDVRVAYHVALFVGAAVRLLVRRVELLLEFPADHPLFTPHEACDPRVSALGDCFETMLAHKREVMQSGKRLYRQEQWAAAQEEFTRCIAMPPEDEEPKYTTHLFLADCHFRLGQYLEALAHCDTALRNNPTAYAALCLRAQLHEALGQPVAAVQDLVQVIHHYPDSVPARELYARLAAALPTPLALPPTTASAHPHPCSTTSHSRTESPCPPGSHDIFSSLVSSRSLALSSSGVQLFLDALPPYPEPPAVPDPTYLATLMDGATPLEYIVCSGKELGRGAFGRVYKAMHATEGWLMAVKEVEAREMESEDLLRAFDLMVTMKHANVVRGLGMRRLPGFYHVVMEHCSGGSLRSIIDDVRGLPLPLVRKYATEVLLGLRYMHGIGLLHRDVKASNVLLQGDGTAKIADFGTCMKIPEGDTVRCESVKGTVLWMAPEAFRGRYSPASDIWSFGCFMIELTTAKDPWHEQQFQEQLTAMVFVATRPDALPAVPPPLSDELGSHFFHCSIARDPSERVSADVLLRHPWLTSAEPSSLTLPPSSPCGTIQESLRERFGDSSPSVGFPWTTGSSDSPFIETGQSTLFEPLTDCVCDGEGAPHRLPGGHGGSCALEAP